MRRGGQTQYVLTSQYCTGGSLDALLGTSVGISPARVIGWGESLLEAVDAMHSKMGRLHLDIKPENIFLNDQGQIKLGDVGISQRYIMGGHDETLPVTQSYDTCQNFVAPEQLCPNTTCASAVDCSHGAGASAATDKWQVGLVLLQLLSRRSIDQLITLISSGNRTVPTTPMENLTSLNRRNFEVTLARLCPGLDADLKALLLDLLERDPSKRPKDKDALARIRTIRRRWQHDLSIGIL